MDNKKITGINYLDELSPEDQREALKNIEEFRASLTEEQRMQRLQDSFEIIKQIRKEEPELTANLSDIEIAKAFVNSHHLEQMKQEMIEILERNGAHDAAQDLKKRRLGIDTLSVEFINEV